MQYERTFIQLLESFLYFSPEPLIVIKEFFYQLLHDLPSGPPSLGGDLIKPLL